MISDITQVALGGIVALLILREVFQYLSKRKSSGTEPATAMNKRRLTTDRVKHVQNGVDAVLSRLDRIIERLEDVAEQTRAARKQSAITGETTERMTRAVNQLEQTINAAMGRRRTSETSPGA